MTTNILVEGQSDKERVYEVLDGMFYRFHNLRVLGDHKVALEWADDRKVPSHPIIIDIDYLVAFPGAEKMAKRYEKAKKRVVRVDC